MALIINVGVVRPGISSSVLLRTWYLARTIFVQGFGCGCGASGCLWVSATSLAASLSAAASGFC